ncbi:ribosome assembly factor SBDS [Candidatus Pacearchaeota archaeon CG10_big_fil_rev_8_21_14_0_10_34_12]|nr:MAG: ribosome assembly factor SBDS [Candidatus Pacearchaeota archaeon CG10_big_fil_rev_8_21_14_0_10_34_12]
MSQTIARIKQKGKHFEIIVDMDKALRFKKGDDSSKDFLEAEVIFTDSKKGMKASESDLNDSFGTLEIQEIAEKITKSGEILTTQEHRDEEKEKKFRQVVDFLMNNSSDPKTGMPLTESRIKSAIEEAGISIKKVPVENQINEIISELSRVIPIRIETKKVKITVPAIHTGRAYEVVNQYKEKENWLSNGDLEIVVNVPSGAIMNFYDKLNSLTHGSIITEEMKDGEKDD